MPDPIFDWRMTIVDYQQSLWHSVPLTQNDRRPAEVAKFNRHSGNLCASRAIWYRSRSGSRPFHACTLVVLADCKVPGGGIERAGGIAAEGVEFKRAVVSARRVTAERSRAIRGAFVLSGGRLCAYQRVQQNATARNPIVPTSLFNPCRADAIA